MSFELGKFATEILGSYAITIGILAYLIIQSVYRAAKIGKKLSNLEVKDKKIEP